MPEREYKSFADRLTRSTLLARSSLSETEVVVHCRDNFLHVMTTVISNLELQQLSNYATGSALLALWMMSYID